MRMKSVFFGGTKEHLFIGVGKACGHTLWFLDPRRDHCLQRRNCTTNKMLHTTL